MTRRFFFLALSATVFVLSFSAAAQEPPKIHRIGLQVVSPRDLNALASKAQHGIHGLVYVQGQSLKSSIGTPTGARLLPSLAQSLSSNKVDVIVTVGTPGVLAAKNATGKIPIVFVSVSDPVANGVVASLARPGGNVTGLSILAPELSRKRLESL